MKLFVWGSAFADVRVDKLSLPFKTCQSNEKMVS